MSRSSQVWGKARIKSHFNIDDQQYGALCRMIKDQLERHRLLGKSFKTLAMRKQLFDCIKNNYAHYPPFVTQTKDSSEQIGVLIALAQTLSYSYQRAQQLLAHQAAQGAKPPPPATPLTPTTPDNVFATSSGRETPFSTPQQQQPHPPAYYPQPQLQSPSQMQEASSPMAVPPPPRPAPPPSLMPAPPTSTPPPPRPLEHRTILVRNLVDPRRNGLCTVKDIARPLPPSSPSSSASGRVSSPTAALTLDDLDYDRWLEFLSQECGFDPVRHVISYTINHDQHNNPRLDGMDKVIIKSRWSWRAALQEILLASGQESWSSSSSSPSRFVFELMPIG
ncbi:hypothetical protein VTO42DRAFT_4669 [Malbranchea cinnamomea]